MFETNRTVILIKNNGLEFVNKNGKTELNLGPDIILYQELIDKTKLAIAISHFISQTDGSSQQVIFLLSNQLVYTRVIDIKDPALAQKTYEEFLEEIPFSENKISKVKVYDKDKLIAVAVNKELYQGLADILMQAKWEIKAVIPKAVYNLVGESVTSDQVDKIFAEVNNYKKFDFLYENLDFNIVSTSTETTQILNTEKQKRKKGLYLYGILGFIIIILIILGYFFKDRFIASPKPVIQPQKTAEAVIEASVSAKPQVARQDVIIQVLNASGRTGEAGRVKDILSSLGFSNISTSNYPKTISNTAVQFGADVPEYIKQEIVGELNKSIASISAETTSSATKNIGIIIGK